MGLLAKQKDAFLRESISIERQNGQAYHKAFAANPKILACHSGSALPPQLLKPCGVGGGVAHGVLNLAVPEIVLNQASVLTLIGKSKVAGMSQHVGMNGHR
jgi:hypothetical protein